MLHSPRFQQIFTELLTICTTSNRDGDNETHTLNSTSKEDFSSTQRKTASERRKEQMKRIAEEKG